MLRLSTQNGIAGSSVPGATALRSLKHRVRFPFRFLRRQPMVELHQQALRKQLARSVDTAVVEHLHWSENRTPSAANADELASLTVDQLGLQKQLVETALRNCKKTAINTFLIAYGGRVKGRSTHAT